MKARKKPVLVDVIQLPELNYETVKDGKCWELLREVVPSFIYNQALTIRHIGTGTLWYWETYCFGYRTRGRGGDYLLYNDKQDVWIITKAEFDEMYEVLD